MTAKTAMTRTNGFRRRASSPLPAGALLFPLSFWIPLKSFTVLPPLSLASSGFRGIGIPSPASLPLSTSLAYLLPSSGPSSSVYCSMSHDVDDMLLVSCVRFKASSLLAWSCSPMPLLMALSAPPMLHALVPHAVA